MFTSKALALAGWIAASALFGCASTRPPENMETATMMHPENYRRSPLDAGKHAFLVDGVHIRYRISGRGPLLILHAPGWGIGATPYEATLRPLEEAFTVVYLWPRGAAGLPEPPQSADLHVAAFVDDLEELRAHLGAERFILAGHSHSGLIALHYAIRHPERLASLLLLDAQILGLPGRLDEVEAGSDASDPPPEIAAALAYLDSNGGLEAIFRMKTDAEATEFLARILPLYFKDPSKRSPLTQVLKPVMIPVRTLQAVTASDERYPLNPDALRRLDIPTVIVSGRHDRFCPLSGAKQLEQILPRATLLVFEESGHFPWLEEPERFFAEVSGLLAHGANSR